MFTDDAVTPVRIEILIDLLRKCRSAPTRDEVYRMLQPTSLKLNPNFTPARATIRATLELGLVEETARTLALSASCKQEKDTRSAVLRAFDEKVLANAEIEKYFALFFAYYLALGKAVYARSKQKGADWAKQFNKDVFLDEEQINPFNKDKFSDLTTTWLKYVGLGWIDPGGNFQANPYERILRVLPAIFSDSRNLSSDEFMNKLAESCPELDGGEIFQQANRDWKSTDKQCSLGLSHALIELHEDEVIQLDCPADSQGWSLKEAEPPRDDQFKGDRFSSIEWRNK